MADPLNYLSVFTGVGWLDVGFELGAESRGFAPRCIGCCEWEGFPASILLARMAEAALEPAPVWCGDIADMDARPLRGHVDWVIGGPPCQPYSTAGKRVGNTDERSFGTDGRGPMFHLLRIIAECEPWGVFLENVPRWVTGGYFRSVGERLCELGYTLEAPLFATARQVGASHRRERVFVMAHRRISGESESREPEARQPVQQQGRSIESCGRRGELADTTQRRERLRQREQAATGTGSESGTEGLRGRLADSSSQRRQQDAGGAPGDEGPHGRQPDGGHEPSGGDSVLDNSDCDARAGEPVPDGQERQQTAHDIRAGGAVGDAESARLQGGRAEHAREQLSGPGSGELVFAPGPGDRDQWTRILSACPWLAPATQSGVRLLVDGRTELLLDESRAHQLRAAGNGVVALTAAWAFAVLAAESGIGHEATD